MFRKASKTPASTTTRTKPPPDPGDPVKNAIHKAAALEFVNGLRATLGGNALDALPPGKPGNHRGCPIHNGLRDLTNGTPISVNAAGSNSSVKIGDTLIPYPLNVRGFVTKFDQGAYPELINEIAEIRAANITKRLDAIPTQEQEPSHA